jgi:3-hydroxyisobutyrate dehydrogenase-like beta-hydroxyacid dehydrogenase
MATNLQKHLSKEGYPDLIVYNRTASRADPLKELGVTVANTLEDAVNKSEIIFTTVSLSTYVVNSSSRTMPWSKRRSRKSPH